MGVRNLLPPAGTSPRGPLSKWLVGRGGFNPVPALADWFMLGEPNRLVPQAEAQATGWNASSPSARDLAVVSTWEPNVTATHTPSGVRFVANCEPAQDGFIHDLSAGDQTDVSTWQTSSGFICFRMSAAATSEQMLCGFSNNAGGRHVSISLNNLEHPLITLDNNAQFYRVSKGTVLSTATWYTISFIKPADTAAQIWLNGVEQTSLTVASATHTALDWIDSVSGAEDPESFSVAGRITQEATRDFSDSAKIKVLSYGWCEEVIDDTAHAIIHDHYLG